MKKYFLLLILFALRAQGQEKIPVTRVVTKPDTISVTAICQISVTAICQIDWYKWLNQSESKERFIANIHFSRVDSNIVARELISEFKFRRWPLVTMSIKAEGLIAKKRQQELLLNTITRNLYGWDACYAFFCEYWR